MDPVTGTLIATIGTSLLKDIFSPPAPAGPSQAQILAMLQAQQQREQQQRNMWLIGGGIALLGVVVLLAVRK